MTAETLLAVLGAVSASALGLAGWTLWQAHSLAVRVAVLERGEQHAGGALSEAREYIAQVEARLTARMTAVEEHLGRRIDALAACVHRLDGGPRSESDG